ncbi:MAG: acyl-ACP thioesterase domain-containing protein [Enterococcus sp.]
MKQYTNQHEVAYFECDVNQMMTIPALLAVALKISGEQSDQLGVGEEVVHHLGLGWVITNYTLEITQMPRVGETVKITTQATEYNKYFCYRTFWFRDQEGNDLVKIDSVFVLMDFEKRKMSSVRDEIVAPFESEKIKKIKRQPKIEKIESGEMLPYRVRFYDIDSNQHVNNAIYFNWMIDVLGHEFLTNYTPTGVVVRFDKEVEYGKMIESHYEIVESAEGVQTRHEIKIGDQVYCEANIMWAN